MANNPITPDLKGYKFVDDRYRIWGDSFNWHFNRTFDQVTHLAIHHTVTDHNATPDYIASIHRKKGWGGIGYHVLVGYDGTVYYVGDIGLGRANIAGNNQKIIGISLIGDFTKELPSAHQILATNRLCNYFIKEYPALINIRNWDALMGHKDAHSKFNWPNMTGGTMCPSPAWDDAGDSLRNRIVQANYKGYPDWENALGVPKPRAPKPKEPELPEPPEVISAGETRIDIGGSFAVLELRQVREIIFSLQKSNIDCIEAGKENQEKLDKLYGIMYGKGWWWIKYAALKALLKK